MTSSERSKKYINKKKRAGEKRVSFFTNEKFWKFISKKANQEKMTISEYLMWCHNFKK